MIKKPAVVPAYPSTYAYYQIGPVTYVGDGVWVCMKAQQKDEIT